MLVPIQPSRVSFESESITQRFQVASWPGSSTSWFIGKIICRDQESESPRLYQPAGSFQPKPARAAGSRLGSKPGSGWPTVTAGAAFGPGRD